MLGHRLNLSPGKKDLLCTTPFWKRMVKCWFIARSSEVKDPNQTGIPEDYSLWDDGVAAVMARFSH